MSEEKSVAKVAIMPEQIFNGLVEYMLAKPYSEVAQIIDALKTNVQIIDKPIVNEDANDENGGTI